MKILHIIHDANTGGAQVLLLSLFQRWQVADKELILVTHTEGHYLEDYRATGKKVYTIDFKQSSGKLVRALRQLIKKVKPDYVHNHLWKATLVGTIAVLSNLNISIYNQIHGVVADTDRAWWKLWIYRYLLKALGRTRAKFVAVSKYEAGRLQEGGIPSGQIQVIYNGVELERFSYLPLAYKKSKPPLKILFIGRLEAVKGISYLLEAARSLPSEQFQISIVGDGNLSESLQTFCENHKLEHIHFLGFVKDVRTLIAEHHVLVAPSLWEVFGISIAEGMAMGKAIIATRVGGIPELIQDGKGGYLCPPANANALQDAIMKLQEKPEKVAAFGAFNRQYFEANFSFQNTLEGFKKLYT